MEKYEEALNLYGIYVGGRADKCNTELHDVLFVVAPSIEETHKQIRELWFGNQERLHIDSWVQLDELEGYRIRLSQNAPSEKESALYFVNLGAYRKDKFTEIHENAFYIAANALAAKKRAKEELCKGLHQVHTDDLFEVDDLICLDKVGAYFVHLEKDAALSKNTELVYHNGYQKLPKN